MSDIESTGISNHQKAKLSFLLDKNLGLSTSEMPWIEVLPKLKIEVEESTDLTQIDDRIAAGSPDIAYLPAPDFLRLTDAGEKNYKAIAIATSKFDGAPRQRSVLVVKVDDAANRLEDLADAKFGYINKSCTSSYFSPAIMLRKQEKELNNFLQMVPVAAWQGQIDAVLSGEVRATMVLEDVWRSSRKNSVETKIIGELDGCAPPVVIVRKNLDETICKEFLEALLIWKPRWEGIYGAFKPYYFADVLAFFHEIDQLKGVAN